MSSKLLDRAFNKALSAQQNEQQEQEQEQAQPRVRTQQDEEAELRQLNARMDASDAIQRMLLAQKDKDYFRCGEVVVPSLANWQLGLFSVSQVRFSTFGLSNFSRLTARVIYLSIIVSGAPDVIVYSHSRL